MDKELELVEHKASILIDALPYIRDFNQKTVVIEYGCAEWLSGVEEQRLMQDIVLLKSVGMRPIPTLIMTIWILPSAPDIF